MPASRARTTIATKPMQNVMWASVTETRPSVKLTNTKKIRRLTPIRISGIAIGASTRICNRRCLWRYSATPAIVPRIVDTTLAVSAMMSELPAAVSMS